MSHGTADFFRKNPRKQPKLHILMKNRRAGQASVWPHPHRNRSDRSETTVTRNKIKIKSIQQTHKL